MAVSFVTRFRKHLAVMPFVVVFVVPVMLLAVYFIHRHHAAMRLDIPGNTVCVEAETPVAESVDVCEEGAARGR